MSEKQAVTCRHVSKRYRDKYALHELNISIPSGGIVGILGPNGSGKSTFFQLLMNFIQPDSGEISVLNRKPNWRTNREIAYLPDRGRWFPEQTASQAFEWANRFLPGFDMKEAEALAKMMNIDEDTPAGGMSRGQEARLMLLICIARRVPLVILDEPFSGIDVISRDRIVSGLIDHIDTRQAQTVLVSTHEIYEAESLFDYVVFLDQGQVRLAGEVEQLRAEHGSMDTLFRKLYAEVVR